MESESVKSFNKSLAEYFSLKTEEASHNLHRNLQVNKICNRYFVLKQ